MDPGLKEYHRASGLAAMAYNSQARGFFAKLDQAGGALERLSPALRQTFGSPENLAKFARLKKLSETQPQPVRALSLAYLIAQPFPAYPIAGCSSMDQLAENLQAANIELEPSLAAYLDTGD
jgi:aryl-alcohol dehydrogenase-like predicted oxidoreductase